MHPLRCYLTLKTVAPTYELPGLTNPELRIKTYYPMEGEHELFMCDTMCRIVPLSVNRQETLRIPRLAPLYIIELALLLFYVIFDYCCLCGLILY